MSKLMRWIDARVNFQNFRKEAPKKYFVPSWTFSEQLATLQATESSLYTHTLSFNNPKEW